MTNHKDEKIRRLFEKGLEIKTIARKLGYEGSATDAGIAKVKESLVRMGLYEGFLPYATLPVTGSKISIHAQDGTKKE